MQRRELLRIAGTAAALSYIPRNTAAVWARLAATTTPIAGLTSTQLALVAAMGDAIIPRTDTPGATDVGVPGFVNIIVAEYYTDAERDPFLAGLDAIDANAVRVEGSTFADLSPAAKDRVMVSLDRPADRNTVEARAFSRLKGLVIHGYFTSKPVQTDVLKTAIMPGTFDGAAPLQITGRRS